MDFSEINRIIMIAVVLFSAAATVGVMKHMLKEHVLRLNSHEDRLDKHGDDLVRLNTKSESTVTSEDMAMKYVSKELFKQYEKNIEQHFTTVESTQKEILEIVKGKYHG